MRSMNKKVMHKNDGGQLLQNKGPQSKSSKPKTPQSKTPKHGARYVAAHGVREVLVDGTPLDMALSGQALFEQLERRDRAFARLIAATVFRRMGQIDKVLAPFIKKTPTDYALAVLRTGAAQILFLDTPAYAAVNGAVALLRRSKKTAHMSGMANAVLRRVAEHGEDLRAATSTLDNIPKWLRASWTESYGADACQKMADMLVKEPPLDLTTKPGIAGALQLEKGGDILPGGTIRLAKAGDVRALPGYDDGDWWVQDISAALPVRLLGDIKGKRVLDMCAAPGGKTLQLAAAGAVVTALDKNQDRLERVRENLVRTKLSADIVVGDAVKWRDPDNENGRGFDIVILDAPCTATGTFRRRPDVVHNKKPEDIDSLARIQEKLLMAAARHVAAGGILLYCTCSLQKREGEAQISKFMRNRTDFRLNSLLGMDALGVSAAKTAEGMIRVLPYFLQEKGGMDGFFIAAFTRH